MLTLGSLVGPLAGALPATSTPQAELPRAAFPSQPASPSAASGSSPVKRFRISPELGRECLSMVPSRSAAPSQPTSPLARSRGGSTPTPDKHGNIAAELGLDSSMLPLARAAGGPSAPTSPETSVGGSPPKRTRLAAVRPLSGAGAALLRDSSASALCATSGSRPSTPGFGGALPPLRDNLVAGFSGTGGTRPNTASCRTPGVSRPASAASKAAADAYTSIKPEGLSAVGECLRSSSSGACTPAGNSRSLQNLEPLYSAPQPPPLGACTPAGNSRSLQNLEVRNSPLRRRQRSAQARHIRNPEVEQMRESVDWVLSTLRQEDLQQFDRPYFLEDCSRRFRELDPENVGLLSEDQLRLGLVKMFPTLKLDLIAQGRCIPAVDSSMSTIFMLFDKDGNGYIDKEEFKSLMKFCQAWRSHFYLDLPKPKIAKPSQIDGTSGRMGATAPARSSSSSSTLANAAAGRRGSGFGPRLGLPEGSAQELSRSSSTSKVVTKRPRQARKGPRSSSGSRPSSRASDVSAGSRTSSCSEKQRRSARPALDPCCGAFYSTFYGLADDFANGKPTSPSTRAGTRGLSLTLSELMLPGVGRGMSRPYALQGKHFGC